MTAGGVYENARVCGVLPERYAAAHADIDMVREFGKALAKLDGQVVGRYRVTSRSKGGRRLYSLATL
jgi:hypothetical protein